MVFRTASCPANSRLVMLTEEPIVPKGITLDEEAPGRL